MASYVDFAGIQERYERFMFDQSMKKWDLRFLELAKQVSTWSKDPSTKCGAVIVRPDRTIASVGYNGFPKGMPDDKELYENRDEKYSRVVHCEVNALIHARESVKGYTLYTYPLACCDRCAVQMIQAGVDQFVFPSIPADKIERWGAALQRTKRYYYETSKEYREYNFV